MRSLTFVVGSGKVGDLWSGYQNIFLCLWGLRLISVQLEAMFYNQSRFH